jgi:zinc protease
MRALAAVLLLTLGCATTPAPRQIAAPEIDLPAQIVKLGNGLTLVMQRDESMPLVGVEMWTRGGAREEAPGQHGISHLFEHNVPSSGRFLSNPENRALRSRTGRGGGAGTQLDYLRFYGIVAPEGLEATLGALADRLESDPMKFSEEAVKRDHDIVVSELRRAMGLVWDVDVLAHLHRGTFGADHPYGHSVSGTEEDVRAATVETMRDWHRRFAGARNAIVFVVGNFDPAAAERMVRHHFGSIPPGLRAPVHTEDVPAIRARRDTIEEDTPHPVTYLRWPIPGWGTADGDALSLFASIVDAEAELHELAGSFTMRGENEAELRARLERALGDGITDAQLAGAKARWQSELLRMLQRPVWRGSRADVLGFGLMFRGDANHYKTQLARVAGATPASVVDTARRWLNKPGYVLTVTPLQQLAAAPAIDRSATVTPAEAKPVQFPNVESTKTNGLHVLKVERDALPLAQLTFAYDAGTSLDGFEEQLTHLGADVTTDTDADFATLSISVMSEHAHEAMRIVSAAKPGRAESKETTSPAQQRYRVLECILRDCSADTPASAPRVFIASGDVRNLAANFAGETRAPQTFTLRAPDRERFEIVDYPSATQAHILLGQALPASAAQDPLAANLLVYLLRARLMSNLRESKGWSYEVYPFRVESHRGGAYALFNIPVQTEKTAESIEEVRKEIARLIGDPVTNEQLAATRGHLESTLTGGLMSLEALNEQLLELARNDLPPNWYRDAIARLAAFTPDDVQKAARELFAPDRLIWVIAGPRAAIENELRELHSAP